MQLHRHVFIQTTFICIIKKTSSTMKDNTILNKKDNKGCMAANELHNLLKRVIGYRAILHEQEILHTEKRLLG